MNPHAFTADELATVAASILMAQLIGFLIGPAPRSAVIETTGRPAPRRLPSTST